MAKSLSTLDTYNLHPNFSIVLPGKCNADCKFCFWKEKPEDPQFLKNLKTVLLNKPKIFRQISITGGEPCLSPQLVPVLKLLEQFKAAGHIDKVVLTTNGSALLYKLSRHKCMKVINHINISRHHYQYSENIKIFKSDQIPEDQEILEACEVANMMGIDVTLNCVINEQSQRGLILNMIHFAREVGASHVSFRKQHGNLDPTSVEEMYNDYAGITEGCPVCRTKYQLIRGMLINWKCSIPEPINAPSFKQANMVYEAIYQPDGELTGDWKGSQGIQFVKGFIFAGNTKTSAIDDELEKIYERMGISNKPAPKKISSIAPPPLPSVGHISGCGSSGGSCGGTPNP